MSDSEDSAVTYTSVYTDFEPGRVFWGTDEEDEDEREPRFIQAHDPDFVPEPVYPEYIPLEDEHVLPAEEQPLPPIDSPTTESPGYVAESDPEEDPEYEDDEEQDGPVDYPIGEGDDGGDDDGDSSRDDAADKDEDMEEEEEDKEEAREEEHIASADSTAVIPIVELVSSPKGTKHVLPPPSIDITTTEARISVWLQASVSLPSMVDVERLLALPTPPLSPLTSLSPPFTGEHLARLMDPSVYPSPLLLPSSWCLIQTQALRITSTQALTDAVTAALPSSSVDRKDEILESERPPRKRSCLFTIGSRNEAGESSTTRPTGGQGTDYRISQRVNKNSQQADLLMGDRMTLQETVWTWEEEAYAARVAWNHSIGLSQATYQELQTHRDHVDMRREISDMQKELISQREQLRRERQPGPDARFPDHQETPPPTNPNNMTPEAMQTMIDQALLKNSGGGDGSHSSHTENPRNMHTARPCDYADFIKCHPLNFKGTEGASVLKKKITDKYCPLGEVKKLEIELWNLKVRDNNIPAYTNCFQELALICTKFVSNETEKVDKYISGLPDRIYGNVKSSKPKTLDETIELSNELMDQKLRTYAERKSDSKRKADDISRNNQQPFKRQNDISREIVLS
nr:reverse transcriptase domain-containing protein [Tanacetum cinerariifolium]